MRRKLKVVVLSTLAGTMFGFSGCLKAVLRQAAIEVGADVVQTFVPLDLGGIIGGGNGG
jgi:hypothetical protein